jgi:hypothetical protein
MQMVPIILESMLDAASKMCVERPQAGTQAEPEAAPRPVWFCQRAAHARMRPINSI